MNRVSIGTIGLCLACAGATAQTQLLGPQSYVCVQDSPFVGAPGFAFEDMEDGLFDLPGVMTSGGQLIGPGGLTDSVDCDDGVIDGSGTDGRSFFGSGPIGITFTFDPLVFGQLPTAAGVVWTDGAGTITFEAFDAAGNSLGTLSGMHANTSFFGETDEDRFYGVIHLGGLGSIHIRNSSGGIEVDHVQYANAEPLCYADCDGNTLLDIFDFLCFQDAFVQMTPYADCTGEGTFDIFDFLCFQDAFVTGCP